MEKKFLYIIIIGFLIVIYVNYFVREPFTIIENVSITEYESVNKTQNVLISFDNIKNSNDQVNFLGFLKYEDGKRYVTDDFNNNIEVLSLDRTHIPFFIKGLSKVPFNITGTLITNPLKISISKLKAADRKSVQFQKLVLSRKNITKTTNYNFKGFFIREFGCTGGIPMVNVLRINLIIALKVLILLKTPLNVVVLKV
jgi:hypothetical protein